MKNLSKFFAIFFSYVLFISCTVDTELITPDVAENEIMGISQIKPEVKKDIRVLFIGNSFTEDACSYIPSLFSEVAGDVNFVFGIAYIPASPLAKHYANLTGKDVSLDGTTYSPSLYVFNISRKNHLAWDRKYNLTISDVLNYEKWDIVTFQQGGVHSTKAYDKYYAPFLTGIKEMVRSNGKEELKLGWLSIHGCYHKNKRGLNDNWKKVTENSQKVMDNDGFDLLFPYGTAVENLRQCEMIENQSDSIGWMVDEGHLQDGLGCLAAAYTNTLVLLKEINFPTEKIKFKFTPTADNLVKLNIPGVHLGKKGVVGINPFNCDAALEAAKNAVNEPYKVTPLEDTLGLDTPYDD